MEQHTRRFDDKVVIVTGGAGGIGEATLARLVREGAAVTIVDLTQDALDAAKSRVLEAHPDARILTCAADVSNEGDVACYVKATLDEFGYIDGFFNNAGIDGARTDLGSFSRDDFDKVLAINVTGVFLGLKHVLPVMKERGSGAVVNTASIGGVIGWARQYGYVASKHAVLGLTKGAASEFGPAGIRVNAIAPGGIKTPMAAHAMARLNPDDPDAAERQFASGIPLGRMGHPNEVAGTVAFLLSADAGFINGHTLVVDGGQTVQ